MVKFWLVFFSLMLIGYVVIAIMRIKGYVKDKFGLIYKLIVFCMPIFILRIWVVNNNSIFLKALATFIGILTFAVGIFNLYLARTPARSLKNK